MASSEVSGAEPNALEKEIQEVKQEFTGPASPRSRFAIAVRALRHRNFQLFFTGQMISLVGTWMQTVAQSWLVYRITGSTLLLGTVGFASQIPVFLIAPLGGAIADRANRHRVVIATQTASMVLAFVLAVLTLTHRIQVWQIMVLAAGVGLKGLSKIIALCAGGFGVSVIAFSFSRIFWLSLILLVPVGFTMMVQMASSNTLLQSMVPSQMRGRVVALYTMMFMGVAPFGAFFAGALAHRIGAPWTVALGGLACIAGASAFGMVLPSIRGQARELVLAQGMVSGAPAEEITRQGAS